MDFRVVDAVTSALTLARLALPHEDVETAPRVYAVGHALDLVPAGVDDRERERVALAERESDRRGTLVTVADRREHLRDARARDRALRQLQILGDCECASGCDKEAEHERGREKPLQSQRILVRLRVMPS
jgi:hypothetical protein